MANLINNLGGERGFGENSVSRNDDGYSSAIDITPVFENGLNLFGTTYDKMYVNTNGNITFTSGLYKYTPGQIGENTYMPIIAPFWADVDTRGGELSAGGARVEVDFSIRAFKDWLNNDAKYFNMTTYTTILDRHIDDISTYSYSSFLSSASYYTGASSSTLEAAFIEEYYNFLIAKKAEQSAIDSQNTYNQAGNSTGSNLVWYDIDEQNDKITITWDDVGYFNYKTNKTNAFQLQLIDTQNGTFDIKFIYEDINWTTGDASRGTNGLGGVVARAGYSAGDGLNYYELPFSGNQAAMLNLENYLLPGQSEAGVWSLSANGSGGISGIGLEGVDDNLQGANSSDILDGRSGDDTIYGHDGDDIITGGEGNDTLYGGAGNDRFFSGFGNDVIDGGSGIDTVVYFYNFSDLNFEFGATSFRIDRDGTFSDTLVDVENISLLDVSGSVSAISRLSDVSGEVVRLYSALLGREPDNGGFNYWLSEILSEGSNGSIQGVSNSFAGSSEYNVRFGAQSNEEFIDQLYNNILGRGADSAGYTYWLEEIAQTGDRSGMIVSFSNSAEYQNAQADAVRDYMNNATLSLDLM